MKTSKDPRHLARRIAFQTLFQWAQRPDLTQSTQSSSEQTLTDMLNSLQEEYAEASPRIEMATELITGVLEQRTDLNRIIQECAPEWPVDQISRIDATILRIAIFELLHKPETPVKVAIDEAVELAKEFGSDASSKFVNGVLGTVVKKFVKRDEQK